MNPGSNRIQLPPFQPMMMDHLGQPPQQPSQQQQPQQQGGPPPQQQQLQMQYDNSLNQTYRGNNAVAAMPMSSQAPNSMLSLAMGSAPPQTTNLTKQGRSRLRVKKACDRCKRQKSKCDGEVPCQTCLRHKHKCIYSSSQQSEASNGSISVLETPTQEDNTTDPLVSDYTRYLENKIREMEAYINHNTFDADDIEETFDKNMYTFSQDKYRVMRRYQNILPQELGKSIIGALNKEESKDLLIPRIQFYGWNMSGGHFLNQRTLPPMVHLIDLTQESRLGTWLLDYYMKNINPLFSIIHEKVFRDQYRNYISNLQKNDTSQSTRLFSALLYLIFAISIRFSENDPTLPVDIKQQVTPQLEERLFDSAYNVVTQLSFEWQSYELIQCWILVTLFLRTTYRQNSSYMSLGSAIRMCKGMSLNMNFVPEKLDKPYEWTKARRVFWLVYTWDRLHGFQSGKGYDIQDRTIVTPFPDLSDDSEDGWLSKPALAMIHLARISGEIQNFVNGHYRKNTSFIEKVTDQLSRWKEWFKENSDGYEEMVIDQVYLTYHDIILNFNNKVLFKLVERKYYPDDSQQQMETLVKHSGEVLERFQKIDATNQLFVPWWLNLVLLFNIALIDVTLINAGLYHSHCASNLAESLKLLTRLEPKAHMARECVWALKMLNHMCVQRMTKSIRVLSDIGIDHGSGNVNQVKFLQFGKVEDERPALKRRRIEQPQSDSSGPQQVYPDSSTEQFFQNDNNPGDFALGNVDLLGNLRWFDQWVNEFDHHQD